MATAKAHTNIALVKYWGKKDQDLIIPQTDSLSMTLSEFYTTTQVVFDPTLTADQVTINDQAVTGDGTNRITSFLDIVRQLSGRHDFARVNSHNHVPTAAGLASSASAFAALAGAASRAAGLHLSRRDLSRLARRGLVRPPAPSTGAWSSGTGGTMMQPPTPNRSWKSSTLAWRCWRSWSTPPARRSPADMGCSPA